jgi:hypothetical protein
LLPESWLGMLMPLPVATMPMAAMHQMHQWAEQQDQIRPGLT